LSSPYPFDSSDPNSIRFQTNSGVKYLVYFSPSPDFFSDYPEFAEDAMTFGVAVENPEEILLADPKVGDTVRLVVANFFEQNPKGVLLYSIDNRDKKHLARRRVFDRWYDQEKHRMVEKRCGVFGHPPDETCFCILYRSDHPHRGLIISSVDAFLLYLQSKP
jgi:hypothetical protein